MTSMARAMPVRPDAGLLALASHAAGLRQRNSSAATAAVNGTTTARKLTPRNDFK